MEMEAVLQDKVPIESTVKKRIKDALPQIVISQQAKKQKINDDDLISPNTVLPRPPRPTSCDLPTTTSSSSLKKPDNEMVLAPATLELVKFYTELNIRADLGFTCEEILILSQSIKTITGYEMFSQFQDAGEDTNGTKINSDEIYGPIREATNSKDDRMTTTTNSSSSMANFRFKLHLNKEQKQKLSNLLLSKIPSSSTKVLSNGRMENGTSFNCETNDKQEEPSIARTIQNQVKTVEKTTSQVNSINNNFIEVIELDSAEEEMPSQTSEFRAGFYLTKEEINDSLEHDPISFSTTSWSSRKTRLDKMIDKFKVQSTILIPEEKWKSSIDALRPLNNTPNYEQLAIDDMLKILNNLVTQYNVHIGYSTLLSLVTKLIIYGLTQQSVDNARAEIRKYFRMTAEFPPIPISTNSSRIPTLGSDFSLSVFTKNKSSSSSVPMPLLKSSSVPKPPEKSPSSVPKPPQKCSIQTVVQIPFVNSQNEFVISMEIVHEAYARISEYIGSPCYLHQLRWILQGIVDSYEVNLEFNNYTYTPNFLTIEIVPRVPGSQLSGPHQQLKNFFNAIQADAQFTNRIRVVMNSAKKFWGRCV